MNISERSGISRRSALAGLAAATAVAAAGCSGGGDGKSSASASPVRAVNPNATEPFTGDKKSLLLQVMAHPDDDLYFMNPDAEHIVRSGVPVVSVYVTAGEAVGQNWIKGMPKTKPDKAAYSSSRHQGLRQAYATMLGVDKFTPWQKSVIDLPGGVKAEANVLSHGNLHAQLIFLNIAMLSPGDVRIPFLWEKPGLEMRSMIAADSPCQTVSKYTHDTLVDVLAGIMDRFKPTVIHTMDPDPEFQVHDATHPKDNDYGSCSDHRDHTPTALFTWKAMSQWVADATKRDRKAPPFTTTSFRGYYNQRWPHNLPLDVVDQKRKLVNAYGGDPHWECGNPGGCGDYGQGGDRSMRNRKAWIRSTHYRYPGALPATSTDKAGRLEAYGVLGTQAVRWIETSPGSGRWASPQNLGGGPLAPTLSSVKDSKGRRLIFALRFSALEGQGRPNTREIVMLEQRSPDGPFKPWTSLGNPVRKEWRGRRVGCPAAIATPDGRVYLYVRTADKGLATRVREPNGHWSGWKDIDGSEIQEGITVMLDKQQRVHVFAPGRDSVHHWTQDAPGKEVYFQPLDGLPQPGGQAGATLAPDGSITVVYRTPAAVQPVVHTFTPPELGGDAQQTAADVAARSMKSSTLQHFDGYGPIGTHTLPVRGSKDSVMMLGRATNGGVQLQDSTSPSATPLRAPDKFVAVGTVSLLADADQKLCVVGMGPDAVPWIWRPKPASHT
ncbi:PIG-L family deacetylase [Streptomyces varsoviensis]|nr:PIG-L family deacetylase [Streptomyces varsoviensis]